MTKIKSDKCTYIHSDMTWEHFLNFWLFSSSFISLIRKECDMTISLALTSIKFTKSIIKIFPSPTGHFYKLEPYWLKIINSCSVVFSSAPVLQRTPFYFIPYNLSTGCKYIKEQRIRMIWTSFLWICLIFEDSLRSSYVSFVGELANEEPPWKMFGTLFIEF